MTALDGATFSYKPSQKNTISSVSHFPFNPSGLIFFSHEVHLQLKETTLRLGLNLVVCASPVPRHIYVLLQFALTAIHRSGREGKTGEGLDYCSCEVG